MLNCLNPLKSGLSCNFTNHVMVISTYCLNPLKSGLSCNQWQKFKNNIKD